MAETCIGDETAFPPGSTSLVQVAGVEIAILNDNGTLYAYRNVCPHQGGPVCEGVRLPRVVETITEDGRSLGARFDEAEPLIVCPWHGYSFALKTGVNICDPRIRLKSYAVRRQEGQVYVAT